MPLVTPRSLAGVAIPALALGLAACSSGAGSTEDDAAQPSPVEAVLASYEDLETESYTMELTVTLDGLDFIDGTTLVDGEASHTSQDLFMSTILDAMGEDLAGEPEMAEMMESMFSDVHSETIVVDDVVYMQLSGGMFDLSEELGADAWFTVDVAELGDLDAIHQQVGGLDLASQTEVLITELTDVEEIGDGVYTGTLSGDSELLQSMVGTTGGADPAGQAAVAAAEVVVTVDDEGLLKTIEMTFPDVEGMTLHMIGEVTDVGGTYDISAPDSDNLHSFEEVFGAMQ